MSSRILIRGGCVLTLGTRTQNHATADVLIEDGMVADIGAGLRARDAELVDATEAIVMPGFVDAHRHSWRSLFRNSGESDFGSAIERHYGPDDVYAAVLIGLLGAVEAGITTVVDWSDIDHTEAALQAHADAGLRTVFVHAPTAPGRGDSALDDLSGAKGPLTSIAYGSPRTMHADRVAAEWGRARELGMRIHVHVGEEVSDRAQFASLAAQELLGEDVTLVHCTNLDDGDFDVIKTAGARVAVTPSNEMTRGLGPPPVQKLIDRSIRPGLGVDDERASPGDIFAQMRATISVQHATYFDLKLAGKGGLPNLLTTRDVIRYATIDGARASGLGDVAGSLEVGKQADVIVLRVDRPNIHPINDPIGAVVWGLDTSNLDWVIAGGRILMREGVLEAGAADARSLAEAARHRVATAAGLMAGSHTGEPS